MLGSRFWRVRDAAAQQDAWYSGQSEKKKARAFPLLG